MISRTTIRFGGLAALYLTACGVEEPPYSPTPPDQITDPTPTALPVVTPTSTPETSPTVGPETPTDPGTSSPSPTQDPGIPTPTLAPGATPTPDPGGPTPTLPPGVTPTPGGPTPTLPPGVTPTPTSDGDGDGYPAAQDCDDANGQINPGMSEVCNQVDDNCNGPVDEGVQTTYYGDADGDGYGSSSVTTLACSMPSGYASLSTDCNDGDAAIHPGSTLWECATHEDFNCDGVIGSLLGDGAALPVNLVLRTLTLTPTLGGQPIGTTNTSATDFGALYLRDRESLETFRFGDLWDATNNRPNTTLVNQVLDGSYDVLYSVRTNGNNAPDNQNALLASGVQVQGDTSLTVNIPYITVGLTLTLNGANLNTGNTSAADYGKLAFRDKTTGEKFPVMSAWNTNLNTLSASYNARLVPGTYDILYEVGKDGPRWPANISVLLQKDVVLTSNQNLTVNVPVSTLTTTVTLNGAAVSGTNTSATDYGRIELKDALTGDYFRLFYTYDTTTGRPAATVATQVIPGTYDVHYSSQTVSKAWPINKRTLLKSAVDATANASLSLNIPTAAISLTTTLGGATLNGSNTLLTDYGSLRLRESATNDFKILDTFNTATNQPVNAANFQLIPGTYDVMYAVKASTSHYPLNEKAILKSQLALTSAQSVAVDIPVAQVTCNMTLAGAAISSGNTASTDYGKLVVRELGNSDRFKLCSAWNKTTNLPGMPGTALIIPGEYELLYDAEADGPQWPGNQDVVLNAGVALANGSAVFLDVPVRRLTLSLLLNGAALSSTNDSATNYGCLELWNLDQDADTFTAYSSYNTTTLAVLTSQPVQFLPGAYDVAYSVGADGNFWPANQNDVQACFEMK